MTPTRSVWSFEALLFDLDGVITRTATLHAAAWKQTFDELLAERSRATGRPLAPFDIEQDYARYVDGRRRYDGVADFLASREIELPWGSPQDDTEQLTVCGVGNRKRAAVEVEFARHGVDVFEDAAELLAGAGLPDFFAVRVTGLEAAALDLPGKPAPDTFLRAAAELGVDPDAAVVFEDSLAGVRAARSGAFGLVVGVDRGRGEDLAGAGADVVYSDLRRLL